MANDMQSYRGYAKENKIITTETLVWQIWWRGLDIHKIPRAHCT